LPTVSVEVVEEAPLVIVPAPNKPLTVSLKPLRSNVAPLLIDKAPLPVPSGILSAPPSFNVPAATSTEPVKLLVLERTKVPAPILEKLPVVF
jgi:hypothetical protein